LPDMMKQSLAKAKGRDWKHRPRVPLLSERCGVRRRLCVGNISAAYILVFNAWRQCRALSHTSPLVVLVWPNPALQASSHDFAVWLLCGLQARISKLKPPPPPNYGTPKPVVVPANYSVLPIVERGAAASWSPTMGSP
jgi:hypothetical protein